MVGRPRVELIAIWKGVRTDPDCARFLYRALSEGQLLALRQITEPHGFE